MGVKKMGSSDLFKIANQLAEKTLSEFNGVEGLSEVIDGVLSLKDSEVYERVYKNSKKDPKEMTSYIDTVDDLLELKQVKIASEVLKKPPLYIASLTGVIVATHFEALFVFIGGIHYAYAQKKLNRNSTVKEHAILERLMSLLDNFDKPEEFQKPDKEFYQELKKIKWDKTGKKLFKKLSDLKFEVQFETGYGSSTFRTGENFALTFLAACNAVHQGRNKILPEDIIVAYKTYLKLLNTDISKLEV